MKKYKISFVLFQMCPAILPDTPADLPEDTVENIKREVSKALVLAGGFNIKDIEVQTTGSYCYYIEPCQDPAEHGGFVPSIVFEDESGHSPLLGRGDCASAWVWGKTLEEAEKICKDLNLSKLGVDEREANRIVTKSMFGSVRA